MTINGHAVKDAFNLVSEPFDVSLMSTRNDNSNPYFSKEVYEDRMDEIFGHNYYFDLIQSPTLVEVTTNKRGVVKKTWTSSVALCILNDMGLLVKKVIGVGCSDPIIISESGNPMNIVNDLISSVSIAERNAIKKLIGENALATHYSGFLTGKKQVNTSNIKVRVSLKERFSSTQKAYKAKAIDFNTKDEVELVIWKSNIDKIGSEIVDIYIKKALVNTPFSVEISKNTYQGKQQYIVEKLAAPNTGGKAVS